MAIEMINLGPHSKHRERLNDGVLEWECEECGEWKPRSPHYSNSGLNGIRHVCKPCRGEGSPRVPNNKGLDAHATYIHKMREINQKIVDVKLKHRQEVNTEITALKMEKLAIFDEYMKACRK